MLQGLKASSSLVPNRAKSWNLEMTTLDTNASEVNSEPGPRDAQSSRPSFAHGSACMCLSLLELIRRSFTLYLHMRIDMQKHLTYTTERVPALCSPDSDFTDLHLHPTWTSISLWKACLIYASCRKAELCCHFWVHCFSAVIIRLSAVSDATRLSRLFLLHSSNTLKQRSSIAQLIRRPQLSHRSHWLLPPGLSPLSMTLSKAPVTQSPSASERRHQFS